MHLYWFESKYLDPFAWRFALARSLLRQIFTRRTKRYGYRYYANDEYGMHTIRTTATTERTERTKEKEKKQKKKQFAFYLN